MFGAEVEYAVVIKYVSWKLVARGLCLSVLVFWAGTVDGL